MGYSILYFLRNFRIFLFCAVALFSIPYNQLYYLQKWNWGFSGKLTSYFRRSGRLFVGCWWVYSDIELGCKSEYWRSNLALIVWSRHWWADVWFCDYVTVWRVTCYCCSWSSAFIIHCCWCFCCCCYLYSRTLCIILTVLCIICMYFFLYEVALII